MESEYYGPVTAIGFIKNELLYACNRIIKKKDGSTINFEDSLNGGGLIRRITSEFIIAGDILYDECGKEKMSIRAYFPSLLPREHILDAKTISDNLYIISTHGYVFTISGEITQMYRPAEASVLYSACITQLSDKVLFIYGTIFSGIQIYSLFDGELKKEFTLTGHKGSIFALEVCNNFLASASDDRTVCVWDLMTHKRVFSSTGHRARIWDLSWLDEHMIVSASEDTNVRVWDAQTGECLHVLEGHLGKHVWCVAARDGYVYSGGNDCSVRKWNLCQNDYEEWIWGVEDADMKSFILFSVNAIDVALSNGRIVRCSTNNGQIMECLAEDETFRNYSVFDDHLVGSLDGHVMDMRNKTKHCLSKDDKVCRIITSLNNSLVNYASGKIFVNNCILPEINGTVTCFYYYSNSDYYYIGFRDGRLVIIHSSSHEFTIVQKRNEAITGIVNIGNIIFFCDRAGHLMTMENSRITSDMKIHPGFLEILLVCENTLLAAGFYQKNFFIFDVAKSTTIFKVQCGGGHRQWQLKQFEGKLLFAYLRLKMIHVVQVPFQDNNNGSFLYITPSFHGREIRCGLLLRKDTLITGDEEGTLIVSSVDPSIRPITCLKGAHSNGIKAIKSIKGLIVTVGSGEELKVWRLDSSTLKLLFSLTSKENDVRFMDVELWNENLTVACSDGSVRSFDFDSLQLLSENKLHCCVTKLILSGDTLFASDSQGNIHDLSQTTHQKIHKNAILAMISVNGKIITGGDDCIISCQEVAMHGSSVTGLCAVDADSFASVGVDRRVVIWKGMDLWRAVTVKMTNVDDASSILPHKDSLIILGCGIERIKVL